MGQFGDHLVRQGAITASQLEEVLRSQNVYGGRLGTNLLDLGYLVLEDLAHHLAEFQGAPLPPPAWLEAPDPRALKLVPLSVARRCQVLPLRLETGEIHVAMLDPRHPEHLDFIQAAASGRRVETYALPEVRLLYWMEMHLGIDRHPRYVNLGARVRHIGCEDEALTVQVPAGEREIAMEEDAPDEAPAPVSSSGLFSEDDLFQLGGEAPEPSPEDEAEEELLLEELVAGEPAAEPDALVSSGEPPPVAPAPRDSGEVAALEAQMEGVASREELVDLVLRLARAYCRVTALFLVRGDELHSHRAAGEGVEGHVDGLAIPLSTPSLFTRPALTGAPFRGHPPEDGIDGRLLRALGRGEVQEVTVRPIAIRGRVVNVLYADNGADPFGESSVAALGALCARATRAYERLILKRKGRR